MSVLTPPTYKINEYITLKLELDKTNIYVNGAIFNQCKYLLLNIPSDRVEDFDEIESIDYAEKILDRSLEQGQVGLYKISPEVEFWGHCSNLQTWAENNYNMQLLHRNMAFPLLEKLFRIGDPVANKVFKEEVARRFTSTCESVVEYLNQQRYLEMLNTSELSTLMETEKLSAKGYLYLGKEFLYRREFEKAIKPIIKYFLTRPSLTRNEYSSLLNDLSFCYYRLNKHEKAYFYSKKAFKVDPENMDAKLLLAHLSIRLKRYTKAKELYNQAHRFNHTKHYRGIYNNLGLLYTKRQKYTKAFQYFHESLKVDPNFSVLM